MSPVIVPKQSPRMSNVHVGSDVGVAEPVSLGVGVGVAAGVED